MIKFNFSLKWVHFLLFVFPLASNAYGGNFQRVLGESCSTGYQLTGVEEAKKNKDVICNTVLKRWDIVRLANGGSMDGPGYGCKIKSTDTRQLGGVVCQAVSPGDGQSFIYSEGKNYQQLGKLSVDPRTGGLNYHYSLGGVMADLKRGPKMSLTAYYDSLDSSDRFYLGRGWRYNLSYYDVDNRRLVLSNGSSFKLLTDHQGNPEIQYQKLKNLKIVKSNEPDLLFEITHKNGHREKLDRKGRLTEICSRGGDCLLFGYDLQTGFLKKITNGDGSRRIDLAEVAGNIVITARRADGQQYSTRIVRSQGLLASIQPGVENAGPVSFKYDSNAVMNHVKMPGGGVHRLEYVMLPVPTGGPLSHVPAVSRMVSMASANSEGGLKTKYCYGGLGGSHCPEGDAKNYLGYASGITYVADQDNLFLRNIGYTYQTEVHHNALIEKRTFNKFHLLVASQTESIDGKKVREHKVSYPASGQSQFSQLPANYKLPIHQKSYYYSTFSSQPQSPRIVKQSSQYDEYGNKLSHTDVMGRTSSFSYCQIGQSDKGCPGINEPFVSIVLGERHYDDKGANYHGKVYSYKTLPGKGPGAVHVLKSEVGQLYNGTELSKNTRSFDLDKNSEYYGYLNRNTVSAQGKQTVYKQSYQDLSGVLHITKTISPTEYYQSMVSLEHSPKVSLSESSVAGTLKAQNYDALGRVIYEKMVKGSQEQERHHRYVQQAGQNYVESLFPNGYKTKTTFDGLGRTQSDYEYDGRQYVKLAGYVYDDVTGYLTQKISYNNDKFNGSYQLVTAYQYDGLGRKTKVTDPLGVKTYTRYNDPDNSVTTSRISASEGHLSKTTVTKNNEGESVSVTTYDSHDVAYAKKLSSYDGFGRLARRSVNGKTTTYSYDDAGYSKTITNPIGVSSVVRLDPLVNKPASVSVNNQILGRQAYDAFGRLTQSQDPEGHTHAVSYEKGLVTRKTDAMNNNVQFNYTNGLLQSKTFSNADASESSTETYSYDRYNRLAGLTADFGQVAYVYELDGKISTETRQYKDVDESYRLNYVYDQLKHLQSVADSKGNLIEYVRNTKGQLQTERKNGSDYLTYSYDDFGRLSRLSRIGGITTNYQYDEFSRPTVLEHRENQQTLERYQVSYNKDSQIQLMITDKPSYQASKQEAYTYDRLNRLVSVDCTGPCNLAGDHLSYAYAYDNYNNMLEAQSLNHTQQATQTDRYGYSARNPVKLESMVTSGDSNRQYNLSYNANNQLEEETVSVGNGRLQVIESRTGYDYNEQGQLERVVKNKGVNNVPFSSTRRLKR